MRRVLTTLMILLVVLVAGLSALVLLVNPNDFRAYMVRQVEARSGYELKLDGPLRWHVWPQLSILSGRMSLTAPGPRSRWSRRTICVLMSHSFRSCRISFRWIR